MPVSVKDNIAQVRTKIATAAARAGRRPGDVKLMAVTKTVDDKRLREAMEVGVNLIGENYVQEAQRKIERIGKTVPWHMIGRLQTNKAKYAAGLFDMVESVDRLELARELGRRAAAKGRVMEVLIEINSGEETKGGVNPEDTLTLIREIAAIDNIAVRGLMTMAPWSDDPETSRPYFRALRELRDRIAEEQIMGVRMDELSMGMTDDYEVAVEEGATIVRIGRAIFGARPTLAANKD
ncbi:MAG: YggS family pyridoxal phosphate-dependent enzyme [Smithellaceae bacterium]|nr:YggS family pyridoxal phosphate-dependent enzyme [Smithellaceae bacterium]